MGFFPCFIAYPWIYRKIASANPSKARLITASTTSSIAALQMGAFFVVLQTTASGISELPISTFTILMQPIHLAIGIVEGLVTAAVISFVAQERPEILNLATANNQDIRNIYSRKVFAFLLIIALLTGTVLSWFASSRPDGLEWAIIKTAKTEELNNHNSNAHKLSDNIQAQTSLMPDYGFKTSTEEINAESNEPWPAVEPDTSTAGLLGGTLTLALAMGLGIILRKKKRIRD